MKNLKRKLFKMRLVSAVLASIELANVGITSYAINPSDAQTSTTTSESETSDETSKTESRVKTAEKMEKMSPKELLDYLEIGSTVEELERYYDDRTLDKSRKDIENFKLLAEGTKNNFFEYIKKIISPEKTKNALFKKLPMEVKIEFFNYLLNQEHYSTLRDYPDVLMHLLLSNSLSKGMEDFLKETASIFKPQVLAKIYGRAHKGKNAIIDAITYDDIKSLRENIAMRSDFNYDDETEFECKLIEYAALLGNVEAFKYFLTNGAKITDNIKKYAIMGENPEIIHIVEQKLHTFSLDQITAIGLASANRLDLFDWIDIHWGVDKKEIASACCEEGNLSILIKVVKDNPDMLLDKMFLNRIFLLAVKNDNIEIIKFLLEKGADINASDSNGETSLMLAVENNVSKDTVDLLIENGADVNAYDSNGKTALMYAIIYGSHIILHQYFKSIVKSLDKSIKENVELLIEKGADVNATDNDGNTALRYALKENYERTAQLLIDNGAVSEE